MFAEGAGGCTPTDSGEFDTSGRVAFAQDGLAEEGNTGSNGLAGSWCTATPTPDVLTRSIIHSKAESERTALIHTMSFSVGKPWCWRLPGLEIRSGRELECLVGNFKASSTKSEQMRKAIHCRPRGAGHPR